MSVGATATTYLLAMLGSALGGGARLWVSTVVARGHGTQFPWGTLTANLVGCLLVGLLGALFAPPGRMHDAQLLRVFLVVGMLGGFTTFSAFSLETILLVQRGQWPAAVGYVAASVFGGLALAAASYAALSAALR